MKLTVSWADGEQRTLTDVVGFGRQWVGDEYLIGVEYRDGSQGTFTGRDVAVTAGSEDTNQEHRGTND